MPAWQFRFIESLGVHSTAIPFRQWVKLLFSAERYKDIALSRKRPFDAPPDRHRLGRLMGDA
jgi:hypothetical protein